AAAALDAVRSGRIRIVPERFTKVYYHWLENIRDWCISRQLWWGHRIPVWYCRNCGAEIAARQDPDACPTCNSATLEQDPDVLDTWFSSGLWPFSTLGWPDNTPDLQRYYPTDVMETGYDILFFWVARMIMMGLEFTGHPPFHTIYLHGLVRDGKGGKMSKTAGNVIDPIEVMDKYGTDALRFTLLTGSSPGNDMNLSLERVASHRNFSNKIWNATRFVVANSKGPRNGGTTLNLSSLSLPDRWIISRHNRLVKTATRLIEDYNFGEAGRQMYDFFWNEYADWYIEIAKTRLRSGNVRAQATTRQVLVYVLEHTLRLLHPYIPFITEAAWQHLPHSGDSLCATPWPQPGPINKTAEADMALIIAIIRAIRNARAGYNVEPARHIPAIIVSGKNHALLSKHKELLIHLARLDEAALQLAASPAKKPLDALAVVAEGGIEIYLPLSGLIDITAERERLRRELSQVEQGITRAQTTLNNPNFVAKAPPRCG
ncbi:MAG: class I tRNA ligase family protein, partial [Anaerolineae bacterium]